MREGTPGSGPRASVSRSLLINNRSLLVYSRSLLSSTPSCSCLVAVCEKALQAVRAANRCLSTPPQDQVKAASSADTVHSNGTPPVKFLKSQLVINVAMWINISADVWEVLPVYSKLSSLPHAVPDANAEFMMTCRPSPPLHFVCVVSEFTMPSLEHLALMPFVVVVLCVGVLAWCFVLVFYIGCVHPVGVLYCLCTCTSFWCITYKYTSILVHIHQKTYMVYIHQKAFWCIYFGVYACVLVNFYIGCIHQIAVLCRGIMSLYHW